MHDENTNPWIIIDQHTSYDNPWISVIHHNVLNPSGGKGIYGKVHFKNKAIGVIAVDREGFTYLVGQYRFTINQFSWEIPEGGCPWEEDSLEAAKRELLEETGLKAENWLKLSDAYLSNSVGDEYAEYFLATGLTQHEAEPEETEQLAVKKLPLEEVFAMANDGRLKDGLSLLALQKLELLILKGKVDITN
ncbi:NUDIX domain-containing protein [Parasediminibacterium sp. JCM 36343]|uniref:NUDIX domain-containing protein n=1 Tax=Parasediminibacterium sp. JCM 36343 TaxID=3374279 RepID=UPI00397A514A